jgi:hypothetical protein
MHKKCVVRLSDEERGVCQELIKKRTGSAQKFRRAQILLKWAGGWLRLRQDGPYHQRRTRRKHAWPG